MLDLPVPVRDVVADGVSQDIVECFGLGHLAAALSYDDNKLTLVVQPLTLLCDGRNGDGITVGTHGGGGLIEEHWELWLWHARLLGMESIVETQAAERAGLGRGQGWEEQADIDDLVCDAVGAEDVAVNDARLTGLGDVGDAPGEDGVAVVCLAAFGYEADEALEMLAGW